MFDKRACTIEISTDRKEYDFGKILWISKNAPLFFNKKEEEIKNRKIDSLMPRIFADMHQ